MSGTWEEQQAERKRQEKLTASERAVFVQTVAVLLGGELKPPRDEAGYAGYFPVALDAGGGLCLTYELWGNKGKISVSGEYPQDTRDRAGSINVSITKTPEQVAKDITRRFLPEYKEKYTKAVAIKAERDAWNAKRDAIVDELSKLPGVSKSDRSEQLYVNGKTASGTIKYVNAEGMCSIELSNVPVATLQLLLSKL